ncbi:hypothetical protein M9Y10_024131 [Tritrichomonas musculus]|uniref:PAS domain-containing protein n=1 Tax=Tritrichomonas musculus TaxID=1915356 RepID=A0ABR2KX01_9EUKA
MSLPQSLAANTLESSMKSPSSKIKRQTEIGEMKLNVLWSKLIIKQIKQILPSFVEFSSITDSNLCYSNYKFATPIFSILLYSIIVCFSFFTDYTKLWNANPTLEKISGFITSLIHIPSKTDPTDIFSAPSYIAIILFFLYSSAGYFSIFIHKYKSYFCHRKIYEFALFITEGISLPMFIYEVSHVLIHIMLCIKSPDQCRLVYLSIIVITILAIPYLFLVTSRTFSDVKITGFPFLSTNCIGSFKQIFSISIVCSIIPIFCNINRKYAQYQTWLFLLISVISIRNIHHSLYFPSFFHNIVRVLIFSSTLILFLNSIIAYISTFFENPPSNLIVISFTVVNIICPIFSYFYYRVLRIKLHPILLSHVNDVSSLDERTVFLMYSCFDSTTYPILSSIDFVKLINDRFPYNDPILVLTLRFLYSTKKHPSYIFQRSAFIFRSSMYNVLGSVRLATLIELSNELMLSDHYLSSMRLNRLDKIIAECVEAHVIFWEAVLLDKLPAIGEATFLLYDKVLNASEYFKFLKIDNNSPQEYSRLYKKFKNKLSVESSSGDDVVSFVGNRREVYSPPNAQLKGTSSSPIYSELANNVLIIQDDTKEEKRHSFDKIEISQRPKTFLSNSPLKRLNSLPTNGELSANLLLMNKTESSQDLLDLNDDQEENKQDKSDDQNKSDIQEENDQISPLSNQENELNNRISSTNNNSGKYQKEEEIKLDHQNKHIGMSTGNLIINDDKNPNDQNKPKKNVYIHNSPTIHHHHHHHIKKIDHDNSSSTESSGSLLHPIKRKLPHIINKLRHRSDFDTYERLIRADSVDFTPRKGPLAETVKNYIVEGQPLRNNLLLFFFISEILIFFGILISASFKYSQFNKLMRESLDYFDANCAFFRSSFKLIFTLIIRKYDLYDSNFFIDDKWIKYFNESDSMQAIKRSRMIFRDSKLDGMNETLYNLLFDQFEKMINDNYTRLVDLLTSDHFLDCTNTLTKLGTELLYEDFNQTKKILNKKTNYHQFVRKNYKIIGFSSLIVIPIFLYICIKTYFTHLNLFYQPPLINKFYVRQIFQYYTSENKRYSKVGNRARAEKLKKEFLQKKSYSRLFNTIFILFVTFLLLLLVTAVLLYLFDILFSNFSEALQVIEYSSFSCIPYIESIFQLLAISAHGKKTENLHRSLVSNLIVLSQFINQPQKNYAAYKDVNSEVYQNYLSFICFKPSFLIDFNDQKILIQLRAFYKFKKQLSYKYLATLKLIHFKLIESIKIICSHPDDYSIAMLIPHEWFNIGSVYEQYYNEIFLQYKAKIISIKAQYVSFVSIAIIGQLILLLFAISDINYFTKAFQFVTKILAILPNNSPFFSEEDNEIKFKKESPSIEVMPLLNMMPISFITVTKKGVVVDANNHAKMLFKDDVKKGSIFKPSRVFFDEKGEKHYFKVIYSLIQNFPYHPYHQKFKDAYYYILVQDITSTANKRKKIHYLTHDLNEYRNYIFPTALTNNSLVPKSIFLLDNFATVEFVFPREMKNDLFVKFISKFNEVNNKYYSSFFFDGQRCSFFVIFSSFNQNIKQRQHLRNAIKCAQYFYDTFRTVDYSKLFKIAITQGEKLICKLTESTSTFVEVFSYSLVKSAQMLRFANPGEIIVESSILNSIYEVVTSQPRYGYFYFFNDQINFRVFENGFSFSNTGRNSLIMSTNIANNFYLGVE